MRWATPYESAARCTGAAAPGARALLAWGLETYSQAFSLGIYNCRTVRGGSTTSLHGEGRAVDLGLPTGPGGKGTELGHSIVRTLGDHGPPLGIQAIVYDRTVWSARSPSGRPYKGSHPHYDHLHIELTRPAARRLTLATFRAVLGGTDIEETTMLRPCRLGDHNSAVGGLQAVLALTLGLDIGSGGPKADGIDEDYGPKTAKGLAQALGRTGEVDTFGYREHAQLLRRLATPNV